MKRIILLSLFISLVHFIDLHAQGCSDAGACAMGNLKHSDPEGLSYMLDDYITIAVSGSKGDKDINYYTAELGYSKVINPRLRFSGKFNMVIIRGELTNTSGISDLFLNTDYMLNGNASFSFGIKIPFNSASQDAESVGGYSIQLPMNFQTSLGTVDVIAGLSYTLNDLFIAAAVQYPLLQNKNQYTGWYDLPSTNNFKRQGDVLARISYRINLIKDKLDFIPGVLPIYHLSNDKFTDSTRATADITGSGGLTLNVTSYFIYNLRNQSTLEVGIGFPVKTRSSRPEGLTRKYAVNILFKTYF